MAKIIGTKLFGSSSAGKLFGTSFVYYGSGYPNSKTYQRVRAFQINVQDVPRFFIDSNFNFGVSFLYWADCCYSYKSDYDNWCIDEDVSALEGFVEDTTWIDDNPCTQGTPGLIGDLSLTAYADSIVIKWTGTWPDVQNEPDAKTIYVYKRKQLPDAAWGEWSRMERVAFKPTQYDHPPTARQTIHIDYNVEEGKKYQYMFEICSARIFCSALSTPEEVIVPQCIDWSAKTPKIANAITTSNTYRDVVNISASGYLLGIQQYKNGYESSLKIILDGVTLIDYTYMRTSSNYDISGSLSFIHRFNTSLQIQHKTYANKEIGTWVSYVTN